MNNYKLNTKVSYYGTKARLEFRGSCLKQDKSTFNHGKTVNIYIVHELDKLYNKTDPVNCQFGAVSIISFRFTLETSSNYNKLLPSKCFT